MPGRVSLATGLSGQPVNYLIPKSLANLFLRPCFVVGIPVAFAIFRFADVTPKARFQLKDRPGISFLLAMSKPPYGLHVPHG